MKAKSEDRCNNMHCLEQELDETSKKSDETVAETRCDAHRHISEMQDNVYAKF